MAEFSKCRKSLQSPRKASYMLANRFLTAFGIVRVDFSRIRKGSKLADLKQKVWALAHSYEHGGFWSVTEFAPISLKLRLNPTKWISNCFWDRSCRFRLNSPQGSEIGSFWAESLGYSPWFSTWRILVSAGSRSKLPETPPNWVLSRLFVWIS